MLSLVTAPPKIYFDTKDLICISHLRNNRSGRVNEAHREAYRFMSRSVLDGRVGVVFNSAAPLEWIDGNATMQSALEIAEVVDSAPLQYELELDKFIWLAEVLHECKRVAPGVEIPEWSPVFLRSDAPQPRPIPILYSRCPEYFDGVQLAEGVETLPLEIPVSSAAEWVERAHHLKTNKPAIFRERIDGYGAALAQDIETFGNRSRIAVDDRDVNDWICRYLCVDIVLAAWNPNLDVQDCLKQVEWSQCAAVRLWMAAREKRIRAGNPAKENDGDDWGFLPVVPYADVVLADRGFRHVLHEADPALRNKVFSDPRDAAARIRQLVT